MKKLAEKIDQQYLEWAEKAYQEQTGNFFWLETNQEREAAILFILGEAPPKDTQ